MHAAVKRKYLGLEFVDESGQKPDIWAVSNSDKWDDWNKDNETGAIYADQLIAYIKRTDNPAMLGWVIKVMMEKGKFSGIEAGFCQRIAVSLG